MGSYLIEANSWGIKKSYKVYMALKDLGKPSTAREIREHLINALLPDDDFAKESRTLSNSYISRLLHDLVKDKKIKLVSRGEQGGRGCNPSLFEVVEG